MGASNTNAKKREDFNANFNQEGFQLHHTISPEAHKSSIE